MKSKRKTPPRLPSVFQQYSQPLYFLTFNTWRRLRLLDCDTAHNALVSHGRKVSELGVAIGRYVVMPDHIHLFIRMAPDRKLGESVKHIKQAMTKALRAESPGVRVWQPGFFDHLLRSDESYSEKWHYMHNNPVRAGLVGMADEWPYQGEIVCIDRV
jgi:putative transposase